MVPFKPKVPLLQPRSVRTAKPVEPEPAEQAAPAKRQRRAPTWLAKDCVVEEGALPTSVQETIQETATNLPNKRKGSGANRFVNWRLLDRQHMIVELEYQGLGKYRGILSRTGTAPTAGVVLEVGVVWSCMHRCVS